MKINIEEIKDSVYEFEGLLELAELREDKIGSLYPLMKKKLEVINALFEETDLSEDSFDESDEEEDVDFGEEEIVEENDTEAESVLPEKETEPVISEVEPVVVSEVIEEDVVAPDVNEDSAVEVEYPQETEESGKAEESGKESKEEKTTLFSAVGPKPAFCINDRFRFRRELFNNSDADFNSAMDMVAAMDDYEEAEDYFIGALGWDVENPEVMDFMAIIRNYFDK